MYLDNIQLQFYTQPPKGSQTNQHGRSGQLFGVTEASAQRKSA